jgi:type II secretory pathway component GspD/PulD (secretin)
VGEDFSFLFRALQQRGQLEVLSRPTLLVQNNAEGNITIGDRVPIVSGQTSAGGQASTTIQYEEVGIILTVTPHINPDGYVNLEISPEISQISDQSLEVAEGLNAAVFSERSAETTVTVKDGETVIMGGLITENIQRGVTQVPILGDIPWLGELFKVRSNDATKTELLIVLTVNVLRDEDELRLASEEERDRTGRLPERIRRHPLMQGLRIRPDEDLFGPMKEGPNGELQPPQEAPERDRSIYGPVPRRYGPPRPTVDAGIGPTISKRPTYGPTLARDSANE